MRIAAIAVLSAITPLTDANEPTPLLTVRHRWEAVSVAFSPDGHILAAGSGFKGILFWDAKTGKEIRSIEGPAAGDYIAFSPDRKTLASTRNWQSGEAGGVVYFWDVATGKRRQQFQGDKHLIRCVAFSADGDRLASHSQWSPGTGQVGAVRVWDVKTGNELLKIPTNSAGHTIAFSPDDRLLAFDVQYSIRLCAADTGKEVRRLDGHQKVVSDRGVASGYINSLAFSADGKMLASASCDNMARIWEVRTGKVLHVLEGHRGFVNAVLFLRDEKTLATGGEDGTIRLWDVKTGRQMSQAAAHEIGQRDDGDRRRDVFALALSPDGKTLASAGRDTTVKLWEVKTLRKIVE
jgi:WD40 repeat protein